jgi:PAS domain S-box-containing protein
LNATLRIVLVYAVVSGLWILLSDRFLASLALDPATHTQWSVYKGLAFVAVTTLLLAVLVRAELRAREDAAAALRESLDRYRSLVELSTEAVYVSRGGRIVFVNAAGLRLFGASMPGQVLDREPLDFFHPDCHPLIRERMQAVLERREVVPFVELEVVRLEGGGVPVEFAAAPFLDGGETAAQVVMHDLTRRKRDELRLRELISVVQELAHTRDRDAVTRAVLRAARRLTDADGATLALREGLDYHYIDEDAVAPLWKGKRFSLGEGVGGWVMTHRQPVVIEDLRTYPHARAEAGHPTFVRGMAIVPLGTKEPLGTLGSYWAQPYQPTPEETQLLRTLADATLIALDNLQAYEALEQRVAERTAELTEAKERAESADRVKSAFLATMSHELRTPLNSILGFTGILLQHLAGPLNPEQRKQLGMVQTSARHLLAVINDVLDLSKIEAGQLEVAREPIDPRKSMQRVADLVRPAAEGKGLRFTMTPPPDSCRVMGDARRLDQILLNLVSNAVKFTHDGEVLLTGEVAHDPRHPEDSTLRISVTDTGVGIAAADLPILFRPFQQIDSGSTRHHEGTGLGLAICRRLARLLGGEIEVLSEPGRGSTFTLTLPLFPEPHP